MPAGPVQGRRPGRSGPASRLTCTAATPVPGRQRALGTARPGWSSTAMSMCGTLRIERGHPLSPTTGGPAEWASTWGPDGRSGTGPMSVSRSAPRTRCSRARRCWTGRVPVNATRPARKRSATRAAERPTSASRPSTKPESRSSCAAAEQKRAERKTRRPACADCEPRPHRRAPNRAHPARAPGVRPGRARTEGRQHLALTLPQPTRQEVRCRRPCRRLRRPQPLGRACPGRP